MSDIDAEQSLCEKIGQRRVASLMSPVGLVVLTYWFGSAPYDINAVLTPAEASFALRIMASSSSSLSPSLYARHASWLQQAVVAGAPLRWLIERLVRANPQIGRTWRDDWLPEHKRIHGATRTRALAKRQRTTTTTTTTTTVG